jgi:hypothetical protein
MRYVPHEYQVDGENRIIAQERIGLLWEMGLGKSAVTLSAIARLKYDFLQVCKVLVIAPKKVAEGTWTGEARKWDHLSILRMQLVMGTAQQRIKALYTPADVYVINRDNVVWLVQYFQNTWPFDMVVVDELSSFKNSQAKRFKALRSVLPHIGRIVGLTGTPAPNGLEDLWAQVYLLDRGERLGKTITWYRERYFTFNPYSHERKALPGAMESVQAAIGDICVSLSAKDYLRMPDLILDDIPVELDPAAKTAYRRMEREMLLQVNQDTITAAGAAALTGKLLQLCNGAVYTEDHRAVPVHGCKIEALQELLEGLNGQHALMFYSFRHDIPRLLEGIKAVDMRLRVRQYEGPADADAWNRGEIDILLAHPASCAYGLNLQQGGHHILWFGLTWSLELYQQANARLHRQGQEHPVIVHRLLVDGGMDMDVAAALEGKRDMQDALMDALQARIEKARELS